MGRADPGATIGGRGEERWTGRMERSPAGVREGYGRGTAGIGTDGIPVGPLGGPQAMGPGSRIRSAT